MNSQYVLTESHHFFKIFQFVQYDQIKPFVVSIKYAYDFQAYLSTRAFIVS